MTSERIGTVWTLAERCRAGQVESWIDACVAATCLLGQLYGNPEVDWLDAVNDLEALRRELTADAARGVDEPNIRAALQAQVLREFYGEIDQVLETWERRFKVDEADVFFINKE